MPTLLPHFKWSLPKAIAALPDSFARARIRIIYIILLFSLLKAVVVLAVALPALQWLQTIRATTALIGYVVLIKILLSNPSRLALLSHIMLIGGLLVIWSNIFVYIHNINLPTLQFVFMVVLASFYTLGKRAGIVYSLIAITPVIVLLFTQNDHIFLTKTAEQLPSPGFEIIIALNFVTITLAHYFFYKAFDENISEKEKLNQQLEIAVAEAKQLAESRSNFLSTMSHELRTPLNSVIGVTELLLQEKHETHQKENFDILRYSALDLLSLINNILDINKLDSEKLQLEKTNFHLRQMLHNVCSVLRIKAKDKQLKLLFEIDDSLMNTIVNSDPTRLSQVIYNLVGNAIKFTEQGSVTLKLALISEQDNQVNILFSITDTGIGIAPERHQTIFELFTQAESGTTRKYGGTGLGLAIVKQVLSLFNTTITLKSTPGKGSTFSFPIVFAVADNIEEENTMADMQTMADLGHLKILVAEDNDVNKLVLKKQLSNLNITPVMVADGMQAYEEYKTGNYDAVFLDLDMPGWDGYETTRKIRLHTHAQKTNPYLIAFTASVSGQKHLIESGFDDFLYKPVSMKDLKEKLQKVAIRNNTSA